MRPHEADSLESSSVTSQIQYDNESELTPITTFSAPNSSVLPRDGNFAPIKVKSRLEEEILPSFFMHQAILNKNVYDNTEVHPSRPTPIYCANSLDEVNQFTSDFTASLYESTPDVSILNNIENLPESEQQSVEIEIFVTEGPSAKGLPKGTPIKHTKEYTSGDFVYGYYTMKNMSSEPIPFEQITVALEGNAIFDGNLSNRKSKNFLRMIDLRGCYTHGNNLANICGIYVPSGNDIDGAFTCFGGEQLIIPGRVYKKFFKFKFPYQLLDESCPSFQTAHLELPPTFGWDSGYLKNGTTVNSHSRDSGKPMRLRDFSAPSMVTIDYSLKARIVCERDPKFIEQGGFKYGIVAKKQHHLRFVPHATVDPDGSTEMSSKIQLKALHNRLTDELNECRRRVELGLSVTDPLPEPSPQEALSNKMRQLSFLNCSRTEKQEFQFSKIIDIERPSLLPSLKHQQFESRLGDVKVEVIPSLKILDYKVPESVATANGFAEFSYELGYVDIQLSFRGASNSQKPPTLRSIKSFLNVITLYSEPGLPVSIDPLFVLERDTLRGFKDEFNELSKEFSKLPKATKVRAQTVNEIKGMKSLYRDQKRLSLLKGTQVSVSEWSPSQEAKSQIVWNKTIKLSLELDSKISKEMVLLPTFQSCHVSRFYNVELGVSFGASGETSISVPLTVMKKIR